MGVKESADAAKSPVAQVGNSAYVDCAAQNDRLGFERERRIVRLRLFVPSGIRRRGPANQPRATAPNGHQQTTVHSDEPPPPHL
jgi:hypothetical protein